ncbi:DNA helicase UvrD [Candidatus Uhrbacteria bacterium]|nr:DNA helicase UvrD [Candidatus Uhrbacteria bacterium]
MRCVVDWHVHSRYSRACSKQLELPAIAAWCARKGINVVATGDWTHPGWFAHLKEHLVESEPGLYRLKPSSIPADAPGSRVRFMLGTELSQIYKRGGKVRRVHNLVFAPSLETVERVNAELARRNFNLKSDGRPILGIDSEDLYKLLKDIDERIILVPAHAWTPWYAVFGSKSGFDSLEECFGEMTPYVYAIETGLSSDPKMNWRLSGLDRVVLISNSDAHSLHNLGREANVMEVRAFSYDAFVRILRERDREAFLYTIEFFPEEGKYHLDGCAACRFSCSPWESKHLEFRCPTCKRPLTLGVEHRVETLADRPSEAVARQKIPYRSIVPLEEIIAEAFGVGVGSKRVRQEYLRLTGRVANEFDLLLETPLETITAEASDPAVAEAISRVRAGRLHIAPGYDGIYGTVQIFGEGDLPAKPAQQTLL